ncbi:hypothetical protein UFOVP233_53 [uncultured Caudovirales phage]|uniref:Uncharacterized protein n=1 Tax=uncultured Caudovirales phage TaxID=2100421 RepID=A0A6J7WR12_9CAUD|nr:hypothetical protein UFOVP233_53 [uncultured Caudovirales phage]
MTAPENRTIDLLEIKWRAKARKMQSDFGLRWMFTRPKKTDEVVESAKDREEGVAMCEIIESPKPWAKLTYEGIMVAPERWKAARALNQLSGLPLMVVVIASDETRYLKVSDFGPSYAETKRLAAPDFLQV